MNEEDFLPMPREEFERLPMDVQVATLEKIRQQRHFLGDCVETRRRKRFRGVLFGAFAAGVLSPLLSPTLLFLLIMTLFGAGMGFLFVAKNINHVFGILLFGGGAVALTNVGMLMGFAKGNLLLMFFGWIFYCCAGMMLSLWACSEIKVKTPPPAP